MLIMTDAAGLSGVTMARIAKESGAAALMVVNTDQKSGDYIYSLEPENDEEKAYAERYIDIPVIMVSLQAGNVITTATVSEDADPKEVNRGAGLPERIRLYAGGDRPFFEDAMSSQPLVYLIHNMLTEEECDELIRMAEGKYEAVNDDSNNDGVDNYLENSFTSHSQKEGGDAIKIERTHLWKGAVAGKTIKDIDERMSQVMGFPIEHYSDFQINKHVVGSSYRPHYDINDANGIMATVTVFLNDVAEDEGGELVFTNPGDGGDPIRIRPKKGLAVVHHNTDENYNFDKSTVHEELLLKVGGGASSSPVKYVAKKFVYLNPQPTAMRIVLPLIAMPFGGKLPKLFVTLHNALIGKFGYETADVYFQKIVTMIPVFLLVLIASAVSNFVSGKMKQSSGGAVTDKKNSGKKSNGGGGALENGRAKAKSGSKKKN
jgi:prolyl 4-hydroxylase